MSNDLLVAKHVPNRISKAEILSPPRIEITIFAIQTHFSNTEDQILLNFSRTRRQWAGEGETYRHPDRFTYLVVIE